MDPAIRESLIDILGIVMSEISEEAYYAGWAGGSEYIIPALCQRALDSGKKAMMGRFEIRPKQALGLPSGSFISPIKSDVGWI